MAPKGKSSAKKAANQQPHKQSGASPEKLVNICFCHNGHTFSCQTCGEEEVSTDVMALTFEDEVVMPREDVESRLRLIPCLACREAALQHLESVAEIFVPYQEKAAETPALDEAQQPKSKKKKKGNGNSEAESKPPGESGEWTEPEGKATVAADSNAANQERVDSASKAITPVKREGRWLGRIQSDNPKMLMFKVVSKPKIKEASLPPAVPTTTTSTPEEVEVKEDVAVAELSIEPTPIAPPVEIDQSFDMNECFNEWCKLNNNVPKEEVEEALKSIVDELPALEPTIITSEMIALASRNRKESRGDLFNSPALLSFCTQTKLDETEPDEKLAFTRATLLSLRDDLVQLSVRLDEVLVDSGFGFLFDNTTTWFCAKSRPFNHFVIQNIQTYLDTISATQTKAVQAVAKIDELVVSFVKMIVEDQTRGIRGVNHGFNMVKKLEDGAYQIAELLYSSFDEIVRRAVQDVNEREKNAKVLFHAIRNANAKARAAVENELKFSASGEEADAVSIAAKMMAEYDKKHPDIAWEKFKPMLVSVIVLFLKIRMCRNGLTVLLDHLHLLDSWLCEDLPDAYAELPIRFHESPRVRYCDKVVVPDAVYSNFRLGPAYEFYAAVTDLLDTKDPVILQEFIRPFGDVEITDECSQLAITEHPPQQHVIEPKKSSSQNLDAFGRL